MSQSGAYSIASGAVGVLFLQGNSGGLVPPNAGNTINIVGSGNITVAGNAATNTLTISSSPANFNYTNIVGPTTYTVVPTDQYLSCNSTAGLITINFPNVPTANRSWIVKDRTGTSNTNNIVLTTPGGVDLFDGFPTFTLSNAYEATQLLANSTFNYEIF